VLSAIEKTREENIKRNAFINGLFGLNVAAINVPQPNVDYQEIQRHVDVRYKINDYRRNFNVLIYDNEYMRKIHIQTTR
jgi:hypothetical protein